MIAWPVDAVGRTVALLLLAMSCVSWALIGWKLLAAWRLRRALSRGLPAFWAAADWDAGRAALHASGGALLQPLLDAARAPLPAASLSAQLPGEAARMRPLRDALQALLAELRRGQAALASIGATAPFVGLLGTVWGIYLALLGLGQDGAPGIERIAAPVGEALVMTAAGLLVAIPAVLGYNAINQQLSEAEAVLDGLAHDLLALGPRQRP